MLLRTILVSLALAGPAAAQDRTTASTDSATDIKTVDTQTTDETALVRPAEFKPAR